MKLSKVIGLVLALSFTFSGCIFMPGAVDELEEILKAAQETPEIDRQLKQKKFTGEKKYYYPNSKQLKTIINYVEGYREGKAINYYKDGVVCLETEYRRGLKHGNYVWNYQSGKPYRIIQYANNVFHGTYKEFQRSGKLKIEADFYKGLPCVGIKEYDGQGNPKKPIVLTIKDNGANRQLMLHTFTASIEEGVLDDVRFYVDGLVNGKCFDIEASKGSLQTQGNIGTLEIPIEKGKTLDVEVDIICVGKTKHGIETAITKKCRLLVK